MWPSESAFVLFLLLLPFLDLNTSKSSWIASFCAAWCRCFSNKNLLACYQEAVQRLVECDGTPLPKSSKPLRAPAPRMPAVERRNKGVTVVGRSLIEQRRTLIGVMKPLTHPVLKQRMEAMSSLHVQCVLLKSEVAIQLLSGGSGSPVLSRSL